MVFLLSTSLLGLVVIFVWGPQQVLWNILEVGDQWIRLPKEMASSYFSLFNNTICSIGNVKPTCELLRFNDLNGEICIICPTFGSGIFVALQVEEC